MPDPKWLNHTRHDLAERVHHGLTCNLAAEQQLGRDMFLENDRLRAWLRWLATEYEGDMVTMAALISGALVGDPAPTTRATEGPA